MEFNYRNLAWLFEESQRYREYDNKSISLPEPLKTYIQDLSKEYQTTIPTFTTISVLLLKYWVEENYMSINREKIKEELKQEIKEELKEKTLKQLEEDIERDVDRNISPKIANKIEDKIYQTIYKTLST